MSSSKWNRRKNLLSPPALNSSHEKKHEIISSLGGALEVSTFKEPLKITLKRRKNCLLFLKIQFTETLETNVKMCNILFFYFTLQQHSRLPRDPLTFLAFVLNLFPVFKIIFLINTLFYENLLKTFLLCS